MAKRKKLQDNNPPRRVEIRGQDHLLAYITPEEAQMLMDNGGAGKPGPMGIPAFYDEGDDYSGPNPRSDADTGANLGTTAGDDSGVNFGGNDGGDFEAAKAAAARAAASNLTQSILEHGATAPSSMTPQEMVFQQTPAAQRIAQSYIDYANIMGPSLYSTGNVGGSLLNFLKTGSTGGVPIRSNYFADPTTLSAFKDIALGQIPGRMEQAKAGYGLPGIVGGLLGGVGSFSLNQMQKALEEGGRPVFDAQGQLKGVFSEGPFGFGEVYTGTPVEGVEGTGYDAGGSDGGSEDVRPVNPETGQCDEGYVYNENMGACIKETPSDFSSSGIYNQYEPGVYATMGLLDQTPQGLLEVAGQPYDFDAANTQFRMQSGTRPQYFTGPYSQEGRTRIG